LGSFYVLLTRFDSFVDDEDVVDFFRLFTRLPEPLLGSFNVRFIEGVAPFVLFTSLFSLGSLAFVAGVADGVGVIPGRMVPGGKDDDVVAADVVL
jgi:hypothetical protein